MLPVHHAGVPFNVLVMVGLHLYSPATHPRYMTTFSMSS